MISGVESCCAIWMPADALVAPGDEADAGCSGRLADRFRHHGGAAFLAADRDRELAVMKGVEHRQVAFAGHAEDVAHAVDHELIDQHFGRGPGLVERAHGRGPSDIAANLAKFRNRTVPPRNPRRQNRG
jgi:hypothetical protein